MSEVLLGALSAASAEMASLRAELVQERERQRDLAELTELVQRHEFLLRGVENVGEGLPIRVRRNEKAIRDLEVEIKTIARRNGLPVPATQTAGKLAFVADMPMPVRVLLIVVFVLVVIIGWLLSQPIPLFT